MTNLKPPQDWYGPPVEFSLAPFWFWNDDLNQTEIARQLDDFQAHGVDAFVLHPRVGLPRRLGWMSQALLDVMRYATQQAKARGMWVILYDEGMYPSGSSSGQVVAENPIYQCRGMVRVNLDEARPGDVRQGVYIGSDGEPALTREQNLIAIIQHRGKRYAIVDRPVDAVIRGLHFIHEQSIEPPEDTPPAADLLNPDAVACFVRLVYERFYQEFGDYFGSTIRAIFTDEPNLLGRLREKNVMPGTTGVLDYVSAYLGYDFTPHLPALWDEDAPQGYLRDYQRALEHRLQETYYRQLYDWCDAHGVALTGHPAEPDGTAHLKFFHWPGQDIVWRSIEPDKPSAISGRQSTQAKAAASVMLHSGRHRNANEFCGAFGHDLTFDEMRWLANWLLVRGCNLLIPHAFYYSVRGPRRHDRPPDVGPHSDWWDERFMRFAAACRRLCWLNTDSQHICHVAILGENHNLPWRAARVCFESQIDFNYLDVTDLIDNAVISDSGIIVGDQHYHVLILDGELSVKTGELVHPLDESGRLIRWQDEHESSLSALREVIPTDFSIAPHCPGLRVRHVRKGQFDWLILFNEGAQGIEAQLSLRTQRRSVLLEPVSMATEPFEGVLRLGGHELKVLLISNRAHRAKTP